MTSLLARICLLAAILCEEPEIGANVSYSSEMIGVDLTNLAYLSAVSYTCDEGTELIAGDSVRQCLYDRTWSGDVPICQGEALLETIA